MSSVSDSYRRLTYLLVAVTFVLILLGGYVKALGAGLSCPDWPLCYGQVFPFAKGNIYPYSPWMIFSEWFHRLWASFVGLLFMVMVYYSFTYRKSIPLLSRLASLGVLLFAAQILLGGLTVIEGLDDIIVVMHLGNAVLIIMLEMTIAFVATYHSDVMTAPSTTAAD